VEVTMMYGLLRQIRMEIYTKSILINGENILISIS